MFGEARAAYRMVTSVTFVKGSAFELPPCSARGCITWDGTQGGVGIPLPVSSAPISFRMLSVSLLLHAHCTTPGRVRNQVGPGVRCRSRHSSGVAQGGQIRMDEGRSSSSTSSPATHGSSSGGPDVRSGVMLGKEGRQGPAELRRRTFVRWRDGRLTIRGNRRLPEPVPW